MKTSKLSTATWCGAMLACSSALAGDGGPGFPIDGPLGLGIYACGTVVEHGDCGTVLQTDAGGFLFAEGLDELGIGDRISLSGTINVMPPICGDVIVVVDPSIGECETDSGSAMLVVDECVTVLEVAPCGVLFETGEGDVLVAQDVGGDFNPGGSYQLSGEAVLSTSLSCSSTPDLAAHPLTESSIAGCTGDLDIDGSVGPADLAALLGSWGACRGTCDSDLDGDGSVGASDLALLLGNWG